MDERAAGNIFFFKKKKKPYCTEECKNTALYLGSQNLMLPVYELLILGTTGKGPLLLDVTVQTQTNA